ncbi:TNF receptor-associated factor 6-B [Apis florea]|uniref:TNF receptor-associated factor 6-B n=1 Tax=Apis florea TaxID=7463 RepID=UPI000629AAD4|nr:TNF receptor-associated factor 6-B [Apis florea]
MATSDSLKDHVKVAEENIVYDDGMKEYLEPRFECPICLTWLRDPVLTSCGHKFCSQCIYTWLQKEGACCPVDSKPLKSESDLFRDLYTSREISQQRTPCPYQQFGCEIKVSPVDMETHINECTYKRTLPDSQNVYCPFKNVGCMETFPNEEDLHAHLEKNINIHLTMILKILPQISVSQNNINTIAAESKLWDPPPKNMSCMEKSEPSLEWQQLLKNLYERIVILEQQNRELSITVSNQKTQLTTLQTSLRFNQEEMFLRSCNGVYIWRLHSFHEKLESMMNDSLKMFYSPGFYTSPNGYKICARINVSSKDSEFLSLLLHIMKSENDDGLDWPFNGTMYFVLVHPLNSERDIREITSSRPDLEAFRKPICELNKRSFGYTEFVRIRDLLDFLQNDCLTFRIEVCVYDKFRASNIISLEDII